MNFSNKLATSRVAAFVDLLDIPDSHYELARDRYRSFGEWLHRPESSVLSYASAVCAQGSFRYGTVNRPLFKTHEYDLDMVAEFLRLTKDEKTQKEVKQLLGDEVKAYALAKQFNAPPDEKHRCWRLEYADKVNFHMDILPAIPESDAVKQTIVLLGAEARLAAMAIAITDDRHHAYTRIDRDWPRSNPKGFAKWFEDRMRVQAQQRLKALLAKRALASIDDVPTWEWKTPLQRCIQVLKRHRDVMFKDNRDLAPISMIVTTLAAHAYQGEGELYDALSGIVERMPEFVRSGAPRIPNPVNPGEDFADRWKNDPRLEKAFWRWHIAAQADIAALGQQLDADRVREYASKKLRIDVPEGTLRDLASTIHVFAPARPAAAAVPMLIGSAPKPWGRC